MGEIRTDTALRHILREKGWSQKELADACGITPAAVCRYCAGQRTPRVSTLARLSAALGVSADELLGSPGVGSVSLAAAIRRVESSAKEIPRPVRERICAAMLKEEEDKAEA